MKKLIALIILQAFCVTQASWAAPIYKEKVGQNLREMSMQQRPVGAAGFGDEIKAAAGGNKGIIVTAAAKGAITANAAATGAAAIGAEANNLARTLSRFVSMYFNEHGEEGISGVVFLLIGPGEKTTVTEKFMISESESLWNDKIVPELEKVGVDTSSADMWDISIKVQPVNFVIGGSKEEAVQATPDTSIISITLQPQREAVVNELPEIADISISTEEVVSIARSLAAKYKLFALGESAIGSYLTGVPLAQVMEYLHSDNPPGRTEEQNRGILAEAYSLAQAAAAAKGAGVTSVIPKEDIPAVETAMDVIAARVQFENSVTNTMGNSIWVYSPVATLGDVQNPGLEFAVSHRIEQNPGSAFVIDINGKDTNKLLILGVPRNNIIVSDTIEGALDIIAKRIGRDNSNINLVMTEWERDNLGGNIIRDNLTTKIIDLAQLRQWLAVNSSGMGIAIINNEVVYRVLERAHKLIGWSV